MSRTRGLRNKVVHTGYCQQGNSRALNVRQELNDVNSLARVLNRTTPGSARHVWALGKIKTARTRLQEAREHEANHRRDCETCTAADLKGLE